MHDGFVAATLAIATEVGCGPENDERDRHSNAGRFTEPQIDRLGLCDEDGGLSRNAAVVRTHRLG